MSQYPTYHYSKKKLLEGFLQFLQLQNYDKTSLVNDPKRVEEFLDYMNQKGAKTIDQMDAKLTTSFLDYLKTRKSKRTKRVISMATIRNYQRSLNRFVRYLHQTNQGHLEINWELKTKEEKEITILTRKQIERLYKATSDDLLGMRDRALLAIFYGCGLRRNEAEHLKLKDVLPDKNLLYVSTAKGGKSRYVPMVGKVKTDMISYITTARPMLLRKEITNKLMIGIRGKAMKGQGMYDAIKRLQQKAEIETKVGLHSLRHTIATHLLEQGMSLEQIAKFLGHSTLESTQIYTHINDKTL